MKHLLLPPTILLLAIQSLYAQITPQTYQRAESFLWENMNEKTVFNLRTDVCWSEDGQWIGYYKYVEDERIYYKTHLGKFRTSVLFEHQKLANRLSDYTSDTLNARDLPLSGLQMTDENRISFRFESKLFNYDIKKDLLSEEEKKEETPFESVSPDGRWTAFAEDYNLMLKDSSTGEKVPLTADGIKGYEHATYYGWGDMIHGEEGERPPRFTVNWSPDSKYLLSSAVDFSKARKMYLLHWDVDTLYRPALMGYYRGSPGDTTMVMVQSFVYDVETGKKAPVHLPRTTHINTPTLVWDKNRPVLYALLRERGYKKIQLVRYDLETGAEKLLYEETSKTNIDNFSFRVDDGLNAILFLSEKSGWRQLYALDLDNYAIRPLTNGPFYVHTILRADPKKKEIYAMAAGLSPSANPYHQQLISVPFSGGDYSVLTDPSQDHDVAVSPDFGFFVDNAGTLNAPTKTTLRRLPNGKEAATISEADIRKAVEMGYKPPETYTTTGKDGKTTIYGAIWKPTDFDPQKKYPVIDQTYTGPHTHMFPDDFIAGFRRSNQALAELGFIVVAIDGLGTAHRSKAFHDHSYKNMGRNLEDHVLFIRALGQKYSWADTTRVGIFGHSAGGYDAAHALLAFPDFYKVGVASSADHDFRMEKAWWPEMYMGWPVDSSYHEVSNIIMAGNLKGKLLITHGGIDENVNPSATFRLAGALVKANKEFDMLIFPGQQHGYRDDVGEYFRKKRWNYFVQHLLGERPLWEW